VTAFVWMAAGGAAWTLGVGLKWAGWSLAPRIRGGAVERWLCRLAAWSPPSMAGVAGVWSGLTELSASLLVLLWMQPAAPSQVVAFGLGAGLLEVLIILITPHPQPESTSDCEPDVVEAWASFALERTYATLFHVATRGLLWIGAVHADIFPILLALAGFVLMDGLAHYGEIRRWDWTDRRVLRRFHVWGVSVAVAATMMWWCWLPDTDSTARARRRPSGVYAGRFMARPGDVLSIRAWIRVRLGADAGLAAQFQHAVAQAAQERSIVGHE